MAGGVLSSKPVWVWADCLTLSWALNMRVPTDLSVNIFLLPPNDDFAASYGVL